MAEKETASQFNDEKDMHLLKDSIKKKPRYGRDIILLMQQNR